MDINLEKELLTYDMLIREIEFLNGVFSLNKLKNELEKNNRIASLQKKHLSIYIQHPNLDNHYLDERKKNIDSLFTTENFDHEPSQIRTKITEIDKEREIFFLRVRFYMNRIFCDIKKQPGSYTNFHLNSQKVIEFQDTHLLSFSKNITFMTFLGCLNHKTLIYCKNELLKILLYFNENNISYGYFPKIKLFSPYNYIDLVDEMNEKIKLNISLNERLANNTNHFNLNNKTVKI